MLEVLRATIQSTQHFRLRSNLQRNCFMPTLTDRNYFQVFCITLQTRSSLFHTNATGAILQLAIIDCSEMTSVHFSINITVILV